MKQYTDLIQQTVTFPQPPFKVQHGQLLFHDLLLTDLVKTYGTPLKLTYLPSIAEKISDAKRYFAEAIKKHKYKGKYTYAYCTKSSHFRFVLEEALANGAHIETSSAYDIPLVRALHQKGALRKELMIICNGFKRPQYIKNIIDLLNEGYTNCIPVLDNMMELPKYLETVDKPFQVGIRVAADEEPNFEFYTSRLGIRYNKIVNYYKAHLRKHPKVKLKMLHFFINTGIRDSPYYWDELNRFMNMYCELKKIDQHLDTVDIGGGFPIKTSLTFEFDYQYMVDQIIEQIQFVCNKNGVPVPHIITEFGNFTVGESGATIYSVLDQKLQNDKELWYMIDGSFITHLPDIWGMNQKYILLPLNKWNADFQKVNLGGLTCDSMDYYDSEAHNSNVFLPVDDKDENLLIGLFHTGAYQESLGGYGGIQHCLIPAPKHIIIKRTEQGKLVSSLFKPEQEHEQMMDILGYTSRTPEGGGEDDQDGK